MRPEHHLEAARTILAGLPQSAVAAAQGVARALHIDASDAYPLRSSFSVYVHLAPAPLVARVAMFTPLLRRPIDVWLGRELTVAAALDELAVPVVRPADPDVHTMNGLHLSIWELVDHDRSACPSPADAGVLLAEMHAALRGRQVAVWEELYASVAGGLDRD